MVAAEVVLERVMRKPKCWSSFVDDQSLQSVVENFTQELAAGRPVGQVHSRRGVAELLQLRAWQS
jgi:hypothetical protein